MEGIQRIAGIGVDRRVGGLEMSLFLLDNPGSVDRRVGGLENRDHDGDVAVTR